MTPHRAGHAAVIGGGMAGVLAARALAEHFVEVTVVERDRLPDQPDFRNGVPQARHLHTLWAGGLRALEQLLPGIEADLIAAGACPVRFPTDMRWLTPSDRWMGRFPARHPAPRLGQPHSDRVGGPPPGRADPGTPVHHRPRGALAAAGPPWRRQRPDDAGAPR
jgi:choline dehydrogenase-like flavoprotein